MMKLASSSGWEGAIILPIRLVKRLFMYRKGFWLILIENDGAELAVACQIQSRTDSLLRLQALIPPTWYPQTFTAFKVREDGEILGCERLPADRLIQVPAHAGLLTVDLELHPAGSPIARAAAESQVFAAQEK
jgi:hypothetical protein